MKPWKRGFAGGGDVAEGGMSGRVLDVDWLGPAGDQAGQALPQLQSHLAHRARPQAIGSHQHVFATNGVGHVHRAHVGVNGGLDLGDDEAERLVQIVGGVDVLNDAPQDIQHGTGLG